MKKWIPISVLWYCSSWVPRVVVWAHIHFCFLFLSFEIAVLNLWLSSVAVFGQVGYQISQIEGYKAIRSSNASTLYEAQLQITDAYGAWPVYLIDLHGSRFQMGYDYGVMLANEIKSGWEFLQSNIIALGGSTWYDPLLMTVIDAAIDWQVGQ